jgi:hypothetical protein
MTDQPNEKTANQNTLKIIVVCAVVAGVVFLITDQYHKANPTVVTETVYERVKINQDGTEKGSLRSFVNTFGYKN